MPLNYNWIDKMQVGTMWRLMPVRGWCGSIDDWFGKLVVVEKAQDYIDLSGNEPLIWVRRYGDVANGRHDFDRLAVVGPSALRIP